MELKHPYYENYSKNNLNQIYNWYKYYSNLKYNKCIICETLFNKNNNIKKYRCKNCINIKKYNQNYLEFIFDVKNNYNIEKNKYIIAFLMITHNRLCDNLLLSFFDNNIIYLIINFYEYNHYLYTNIIDDYNNLIKIDNLIL